MDFDAQATEALEKRARAFEARKAIVEDAALTEADKRSRVEAVDAEMATLEAEARSLVERGEREVEVRELRERAHRLQTAGRPAAEARDAAGSERDLAAEFRSLARGDIRQIDVDLRGHDSMGNLRTAVTGTAGNAGNTKPTATFVAQVIEAMRWRSPFMGMARTLTTSGGEPLEFPVKAGKGPNQGGAVVTTAGTFTPAENTAYSKGDQSWTKANIGAFKYGIIVEATQEIIDDAHIDILSILAGDAGEVIADNVTTDLLVGAGGSGKAFGWVTRATAGPNVANLAALSGSTAFDNFIDLEHSLTLPYRRGAAFVCHDDVVKTLRKVKDGQGRYLWEPSLTPGAPDTLHGYPVLVDPNMVTVGAGAKILVFGDPSKYLIRQVNNLRVVRSDEYGFDRDVVAFKVSWRGSGDLLDLNAAKALTVTA